MTGEGVEVHLNDIGQIALTVQNLEEARHFYQNVIGMQFLFDAGQMAFFQCGTVRLMLGTSETAATGGMILYFRVSDLQAVYDALKSKGASFLQEPHLVARMESHDLWIAFLKDPSGNTLGLMSEVVRTQISGAQQ